jgi:uncharacterized protein YpmB
MPSLVLSIIIIIVILVIVMSIYNYFNNNKEHYEPLFPLYAIKMIPSKTVDDMARHVKLNKAGGIDFVSMTQRVYDQVSMTAPLNSKKIKCPDFIDKYITLGTNNYCWI